MDKHPRKDAAFYERKVELGIVDKNSVFEAGLEIEGKHKSVRLRILWVREGVTDSHEDQRQAAAPQGGVAAVVVRHRGLQGERVVSDTALDI